ncbi:MAG TPA: GAF domain-containing protein, partial [Oculatellaceae cyanobacterium]
MASLLPVGIFHTDVAGHYLSVNQCWCEMAGITAAEAQGNGWVQVLYPDDKERVFAEWYRTVQENLPFQSEYRFQRPDGKTTWVLSQAVAEKDKTGTAISYIGTITDITERKRTEEDLSKYRLHLEELVQERTAELRWVNKQLQQEVAERKRLEELLRKSEEQYCTVARNITQFKQAEEKLALRNRELLTLHRISQIHLGTQSLKATFQEIVEEISAATGFPIIAIELYDESRQMMVFEAMKGIPLGANTSVLEVPADQTLSGTVARTGQPVIKIYEAQESKKCDSNETLRQLGLKTFICMPMSVKGRAIGTLSLAHPEVVELDEYLPQWIGSLANYVASLTERKQTEIELLQANERFQLAAAAVSGLIYDWDIEKKQVQRTQGLINLLGYHPEEAESTNDWWRDRIHPDDWQRLQPLISASFTHDNIYAFEYRVRNKDNQYLHVWDHGMIVRDAEGRPIRVVGSTIDITERKQSEEALRQQFLREQIITRISQRIHQSLNLEEILNTTVSEVQQFLACDRVIIYRLHSDGSGVVIVESVGSDWKPISGTIIHDSYFAQTYIKLYRQGRVQVVEDIYTAGLTQCHVDLLAQFQAKANLVVPIVQDEGLWGLLVAHQCSGTRQWLPLEIELLQSLATQAAIAIQKSELYEQAQAEIAQRQQAEAALLQQFLKERLMVTIAQRIRQSLNLEEMLNTTVAEVQQFLQTDRVLIYRVWSNGTGSAVTEAVVPGLPTILGRTFPEEVFPQESHELYRQGRVLAISDIEQAKIPPCLVEFVKQFGVKAKLVVPILQEETLWGLLVVHHCRSPRQWQALEIDLLKSLATQLAIALQQSQLYKQTQYQVHREQALNRVIQTIRSSLDLTTIFSTALSEIAQLLEIDRADIMQYLPQQQLWRLVAEYPQTPEPSNTLGVEVPDDGNEIAARLKRLEIVRIEDTSTDIEAVNQCFPKNFPGAWLLVPLHIGSSVWGSLSLIRNSGPSFWQDSEVELTCALTNQLAIALQQAELYQQSRTATTTALTQKKQLEQTLIELQRTQSQLVQSEKMSSLGQLVAGVAHEINNPVTFIYANLAHAEGYTQDIVGLLQLFQQQYPNPVPEIQSEIEAIDLDFLIEDLPKLLSSMKFGAERIFEIVGALRNFSRLAEAEMKAVDIHEGLDSTLTILQNRLKAQGKHPG